MPDEEDADYREAVDEMILENLRMKGVVNEDTEIIRKMDDRGGKSAVIPVAFKSNGELDMRSHIYSTQKFEQLTDYVTEKSADMAAGIFGGNVDVNPYHTQKEDACTYCPYHAVCGFSPDIPGGQSRSLKTFSDEEIWKKSGKELMKMANRWTEKQFKAIRTNGCNILVAAAAGSGKTAVLVERIIRKITAEDGTDVDRMVVVTFTKAAAAEMKQRIRETLDAMLQENPGNERLIRQMTLIHNAPITTIDSFCLNIVRNYFTDIELDPGFRIADEGEMKLLENDVMEEMLEEYYASENQVFFDFVDAYGTGRDDTKIVDIILKLYRFARSYPWPEEWFKDCLCIYRQADIDTAEQNAAIGYLFDTVRRRFKDYDRQYEKLENICNEPDGPLMYAAAVQSDHAGIRQILDTQSYEELVRKVRLLSFETLGRSRSKDISEVKKAAVKQIRDEYKAYVTKTLQAKLFTKEFANLLEDIRENKPAVEMMMTLAQDFTGAWIQKSVKEMSLILTIWSIWH